MSDDEELFRQEFSDVKPLKKSNRVRNNKPLVDPRSKAVARRAAVTEESGAADQGVPDHQVVSDDYLEMVKPTDMLSFKKPGVQDGVFRKLRLGKYEIEGRLDLHRKTVEEARREVHSFLSEAMSYDARTVLILHGKGERNPERQAVIKSHVRKWLLEHPDVLAFHSAKQKHGGVGALYVLLRKSEAAKEKTRESLHRPE